MNESGVYRVYKIQYLIKPLSTPRLGGLIS